MKEFLCLSNVTETFTEYIMQEMITQFSPKAYITGVIIRYVMENPGYSRDTNILRLLSPLFKMVYNLHIKHITILQYILNHL